MTTLQNVDDAYPLTDTQQGMVFHTISDPESGVYVNQVLTPISGSLDVQRFVSAWDRVVERHAGLRTAFLWDGLDDPLQVVRSEVSTEWEHLDFTDESPVEQDARLQELLTADRRRGFDLAQAPLCRMRMIRLSAGEWVWVWSFHHVIADGWSANRVLAEVFDDYAGDARVSVPTAPYREFVGKYLDRDVGREETFWRERLRGYSETQRLSIPGLPPAPGSAGHATHDVLLDRSSSEAFASLARDLNVTLNTAFLGLWALALSSWTRTTDVVFGTTVAGRTMAGTDLDDTVGLFINTLPLRIQMDPTERLGSWLRSVQRSQIETREFEQSSLASVQRWSALAAGEALFDNVFVFENYPRVETGSRFDQIEVGAKTYIEQSNYPLAVLVVPADPIRISLVYDTSVFPATAMETLDEHLRALISSMIANPDTQLARLSLVSATQSTLLESIGTGPDLPKVDESIHGLIRAVAEEHPDAVAVVDRRREVSYGNLMAEADAIAHRLAQQGIGRGDVVGLFVPRSTEMIVGLLGILAAGAAYAPLDPDYPDQHLRVLLEGAGISAVLTTEELARSLPDGVAAVLVDGEAEAGSQTRPQTLESARPTDLAYVIHTSGSTGKPKGVGVTHQNLVQSTRARFAHYGDPVGRFLLLSSFAFDSSVVGIFWTLTTGGSLVLPDPGQERDLEAVLGLLEAERVTHTLSLPSLYELLLEGAETSQLSSLSVVIVAGEACPPRVLDAHRSALPTVEFHNEYGPTEATVWCTVHHATGSSGSVPIGTPIAGARIFVLDSFGRPVPPGFAGEICVGGEGVVDGYVARPDLTAEKFVTLDLFGERQRVYRTGDLGAWQQDGSLLYLGRIDTQLKIRGHRIEPAAIESEIRSLRAVDEAAVVGLAHPGRRTAQLVAYVAHDGAGPDSAAVKDALAASLPPFMVPDLVVPVAKLPRLPNGKVDVDALPAPLARTEESTVERVPPRNEPERVLATIWEDLLGLEAIGVTEDFFELGGDSIVSIRMISRARQRGINIDPGQVATHPTIEQLVASSASQSVEKPEPVVGDVPLGAVQRWFLETPHPHPEQWNMSRHFSIRREVSDAHLDAALKACVAHHDMLRARFVRDGGTWTQHIAEDVPSLEVFDESDGLDAVVEALQRGLDLSDGPLIRVAVIRGDGTEHDHVLMVVHHLVIDAVSWSVLIDDFEEACLQAQRGESVVLPDRTTSFRDWVLHIAGDGSLHDRPYWESAAGEPSNAVVSWGTEASSDVVEVRLDTTRTRQLTAEANDAYRTSPEELLIAALGYALPEDQDGVVRIGIERHGRPEEVGVDLSRTVGWFTAQMPIELRGVKRGDDEAIIGVKEIVRSIPHGGVGYGVLKYIARDESLGGAEPAYLFNYLGRSFGAGTKTLAFVSDLDESSRHADNMRSHRIEVVASVQQESLVVAWHFSSDHDTRRTIEALADDFISRLNALIDHCVSDGSGRLTPSDFPAAGLDQGELDDLLREL